MTGHLGMYLELSPPKPLDQSKNVIAKSYHQLFKDQNGPKNHQKVAKMAKNANRSPAPFSEAAKALSLVYHKENFETFLKLS